MARATDLVAASTRKYSSSIPILYLSIMILTVAGSDGWKNNHAPINELIRDGLRRGPAIRTRPAAFGCGAQIGAATKPPLV